MFCKYCGKEIKDGTRFCPYCGKDQMPDEAEDAGTNEDHVFKKQRTAATSSEKQKPEKQPARGNHSAFKPGPLIAVLVVVVVVVAVVFGVTRNSGTTNETETANEQASTNEVGVNGTGSHSSNTTVTAWVVGEGRTSVNSVATASNNKSSYQDQINTISSHFNDYEIVDPYTDSSANTSYRMFELLCVIAEELDSSGTYANVVAESAAYRYEDMDAETAYANIQVVNGLYRSAEMLASILYELDGEESVSAIDNIMSAIIPNPNTENFLECKGSATTAIFKLLYYTGFALDLPDTNLSNIQNVYNIWEDQTSIIADLKDKAIYNANECQSLEDLVDIFYLFYHMAGGLDSSDKYSDDIEEIRDNIAEIYQSLNFTSDSAFMLSDETEEALWEATLLDGSMRLSGIMAELLY